MKMVKLLLMVFVLSLATGVRADNNGDGTVLLAPINPASAGAFDWVVSTIPNAQIEKGGTADKESLRSNSYMASIAKLFAEGYAIYSITKIDTSKQQTAGSSLFIVFVRPKK